MVSEMEVREWENSLRREKRRLRRAAYHEVGHALAMYLCYGNIDRIGKIYVDWKGGGMCEHESPFDYNDYMDFLHEGGLFGNLFNEVCYSVGGGLCEAMYCNKATSSILKGFGYKFPIKGMEGDIKKIVDILMFNGIVNQKDVDAFIRMAVLRLKCDFFNYADKIKLCVEEILKWDGMIDRMDFYRIFDERLYKKELAKSRRERKRN
jgi:hypothetical protein